MLEFYPNPSLTHQGLLQGHHESLSNTLSCNGHGRTGNRYFFFFCIDSTGCGDIISLRLLHACILHKDLQLYIIFVSICDCLLTLYRHLVHG